MLILLFIPLKLLLCRILFNRCWICITTVLLISSIHVILLNSPVQWAPRAYSSLSVSLSATGQNFLTSDLKINHIAGSTISSKGHMGQRQRSHWSYKYPKAGGLTKTFSFQCIFLEVLDL